ncbi:MAG: RNA polymerase sigma-70 factor [Bacteroidales bacterium]|nr:RNA polymerase sigma-70 factor [Bacteroidales bacterium]
MQEVILHSDEKLIQEIKADNMFAFDTLYKNYSKKLYKFAYSILKSQEESENIVQEVFLKLWESRNRIEKDSSVKSYLFSIAYNSTITVIRKKAKDTQFIEYLKSLQEVYEEPDLEYEYKELTEKLHDIVYQLPERQKEVYVLHQEMGLTYKDIAEKLHISVNTVENHMSRALKTIRCYMKDYSILSLLYLFLFI